jgi:hypothetical protein
MDAIKKDQPLKSTVKNVSPIHDTLKLEEKIIALYDSNLVNLFSINQIARALNKTYPFVNKKVTELLDRSILKKTVVGKSHLCSLNFENEATIHLLLAHQLQKKRRMQTEAIERFIRARRLSMTIHCVVRHGDKLLFVVENLKDRREIAREFPTAEVCDKKEFLDYLIDDKDIFRDHVVIYGAERFFELLMMDLSELKKTHSPLTY